MTRRASPARPSPVLPSTAFFLLMMGALALGPAQADAQTKRRTAQIADHRFIESELVPLPIVNTNLVTSLGAGGAADLEVEIFDQVDSLRTRTIQGDLIYLTLDLAYQQAVNDWLAPWLGISIAGRIGTNSVSIVSEGVAYQYSWDLGWLVRVAEWDRARLGATVNLWNSNWGLVRLDEWLKQAIAEGEISEDNELFASSMSLAGGAGLRYAQAINATWGWAALAESGAGETPNSSNAVRGFFRGALVGDVDLNPKQGIPIGLALGYRFDSFPGLEPDVTWRSHQGLFRIEYTGRSEYAVALETIFALLPASDGATATVVQVRLGTRYYF